MLTREDKIAFIVCFPIVVVFVFGMGYFLYSQISDTRKVEQVADVPKAQPPSPKIETTEKRNKDQKHAPQVKKETELLAHTKGKQNVESTKKDNNEKSNLIQVPGLPFQFSWAWTINDLKPYFEKISQKDKDSCIAVFKGKKFNFTFKENGEVESFFTLANEDMIKAFNEAIEQSPWKTNLLEMESDKEGCKGMCATFPKKYRMFIIAMNKAQPCVVLLIIYPTDATHTDSFINTTFERLARSKLARSKS